MSVREVGSYIGYNRVTSTSQDSASGIWSLAAAERRMRAAAWPMQQVPLTISGLQLWLDASDATTLYDATSGGSLVAADGGVARWEDKSGNARHATQGTSANRPARKTAILGGRDVLRFDGSNDFFSYASELFTFTGAATVFVVCRNVTNDNEYWGSFISEYRGTGTSVMVAPYLYDTTHRGFRPGLDAWANQTLEVTSSFGSPTQTSPAIIQYHWTNWSTHKTNGDTLIGINSDSSALTSLGGSPVTFSGSATFRQIGAAQGAGGINASSVLNGDIAEILVWTTALTSSERLAVRQYLADKWTISIT